MEVQDNSDKKFSKLSRFLTPKNTKISDSRENYSVSEQITNNQNDGKSRKRKAVQRGKAKEHYSANVLKI